MKLKKLVCGLFLSTALAAGVGVSIGMNFNQPEVAFASTSQDSEYCFVGSKTGWANGTQLYTDTSSTDKGFITNFSVSSGDTFKFKKLTTWNDALGWDALNNGGGGSAKNAFKAAQNDGNIEVVVTGSYNFYITSGSKIFVEFVQAADIYVQVQDWDNTYVYAFDETTKSGTTLLPLGGWPGTKVSSVTAGTNFNGSLGGIAKMSIPYHTMANTKLIVNNGAGTQSGNKSLGNNYYYLNSGTSGSSADGAQAKVVFDIEGLIESKSNKSVCQVSKSEATSLVAAYDGLSTKTKVNASTYWTWSKSVGDGKANHTYAEIVEELRKLSSGAISPSQAITILNNSAGGGTITIIAITSVSIAAIGGYFLFKKKHN